MKIFLVICVYIVAVNAFPEHKTWSEFKLNFNKNYLNIKEEQLRLQIFKNNLKRIEELNAKYEKGEVSYFFAVNEFADMTSQEFMTMVNGQLQIQSESELNTTLFDDQNYNVPASVDWRSKADVGVKNQKQCGSCWAFSTTGALEGQLALKRNKKISLSEQQLVDCNKVNHGCRGGDMRQAFKYVQINGIDSEASYKYTAKDGSCKKGTKVLDKLSGYKAVAANENALKTAVGTIGPVSIGVNADNNWQFYGGGIFDHSQCSNKLNHGVLAVGYGNDKKDYWIIKNSWGTDWGEKGYIRLVRGKNQCGVSSYATYPVL